MAICAKCGRKLQSSEISLCTSCEEHIDEVTNMIKVRDNITPEQRVQNESKAEEIISTLKEKAMRDNGDKLQYGLIAPEILTALAGPYTMGAKKYAPRNCEKPMSFTDLDSALERHMNSFRRGEHEAKDSGLSHLHHAIWNIGMMIMHLERGTLIDDRPQGCTPNDQYWKQPKGFYKYSGKGKSTER